MNATSKTNIYKSRELYLDVYRTYGHITPGPLVLQEVCGKGEESLFFISKTLVYNLEYKGSFRVVFQTREVSLSMSL